METRELRGGALAAKIREEVRREADALKARGVNPRLAAVYVGNDASVLNYLEVKSKNAEKYGVLLEMIALPEYIDQRELETKLAALAAEENLHGIILEFPLPGHLDADRAVALIPPVKDVDGLTPWNLGLSLAGKEGEALISATAQACVLMAESEMTLAGTMAGLVGKGRTVGKPLIPLLLNRGATLVICHSKTADLKKALENCSVIFSGVGKAGVLDSRVIREGQTIIDAGTAVLNGKLMGDAALDVWGVAAAVTPVPEGIGPLTTALLFRNLLKAIRLQGL